ETAVSMMLDDRGENALCRLCGVEIAYRPHREELQQVLEHLLREAQCSLDEVDAVMIGTNGNPLNDQVYTDVCPSLVPGKRLLRYKHLFGESYTAPGLATYAAATLLYRQRIPAHLLAGAVKEEVSASVKYILLYNHFEGKNHSFILLSACGK
ncbi:MAG: hypothetical protein LBF09_07400, partial [Odoribacteraceae bacterium]|nr:hypothetical protein [Odoribacteraceae bacterium]